MVLVVVAVCLVVATQLAQAHLLVQLSHPGPPLSAVQWTDRPIDTFEEMFIKKLL